MAEEETKVSVCVVTYNQEKYIRECLQSIVDQKTNFSFEIIVGDDCSTDGTRTIVEEFVQNYPDLITPIFFSDNVGAQENYLSVHALAKGEYIAHIDGDDFMMGGKLQVQSDCLDANPKCNIVWHAMRVVDGDSNELREEYLPFKLIPKDGFERSDLLMIGSVACHSSKMYRAKCRKYFKPKFACLDMYVDVQHIGDGKGIYISKILGGYRANVGISSAGFDTRRLLIDNLGALCTEFSSLKANIGALAIRLLVGDVLRKRPTLKYSWELVRNTLSVSSLIYFCKVSILLKYGKTGARTQD